jgi:hypothetical protein
MILLLLSGLTVLTIFLSGIVPPYGRGIKTILSVSLMITFVSVIFFLSIPLRIRFTVLMMILTLTALAIFYFKPLKIRPKFSVSGFNPYSLYLFMLLIFAIVRFSSQAVQWGDWDNWAIWSAHARFLVSEDSWENLWSRPYSWSHNDYPLMLPSLIAMVWKFTGDVSYLAPMIISFLPLAGIILLLYNALPDPRAGIFAALLITTDNRFIFHTASQYADVMLSFFFLLFFVLISDLANGNGDNKQKIFVTGIVASCGMWIKNEGVFFYLLSAGYIFHFYGGWNSSFRRFLAGSLAMLIFVTAFHVLTAPANDIASGLGSGTFRKIMDPARYFIIVSSFFRVIVSEYPLLPLIFVSIFLTEKVPEIRPVIIIVLLIIFYLAIYLVTPHNLEWHLRTSLNRIILHTYPSMIYFFLWSVIRLSPSDIPFNKQQT